MATHDYVIDNSTGANVRADLNLVLQAILSNNSSSSAPSTTAAYMWWADTTNGILKIRNSANNAWVELLQLDGTLTIEDGSASTPGLAFRDDLNTGIYQDTNDELNIATAGVERLSLGASNTIFNESGADVDFRIEGDTQSNLFVVDAGEEKVGIGTDTLVARLNVHGTGTDFQGLRIVNTQHNSGAASSAQIKLAITNSAGERSIRLQCTELGNDTNSLGMDFFTGGSSSNNSESLRMRIDEGGRLLLGKTSGSFMLDIGAGSSSLVRLTNTLESSHGSHDANLVTGGSYYQNLAIQSRSIKLQTFNDSSVVNGFTLTPNQKALFGTYFSETTSGSTNHQLNVQGTDHNTSGILAARFSADDGGPRLTFLKSRSSSGGGVDKLNNGDTCGSIFWVAANNADLTNGFMAAIDAGADGAQGGADTPGRIRFFTTPDGSSTLNERMRISASGFVGIGTTTADKNLVVKRSGNVVVAGVQADAASAVNIDLSTSISTGRAFFFRFLYNGSITGNVYSDGSTTVYNTSSDYRLKENVIGISDGITRLKALKPSRFNFKRDSSTTVDGFLAHEVSSIVPEAISGTKDEVATEDNVETGVKKGDPIYQGIDQSKLVPLLVAAVQELITKVETLESA